MMYHQQERGFVHRTNLACAQIVLSKVAPFYAKANIPMVSDRRACENIIKLLKSNAKYRAIPNSRRENPKTLEALKKHEVELSQTFRLWPPNPEKLIKNAEDRQFLHSMMTDRKATFGCFDKVLDAQTKRKEARTLSETKRREKVQLEMEQASTSFQSSFTSSEDNSSGTDCAPESTTDESKTPKHRRTRTGTAVVIPHNILQSPKVVSLATRMQMTPAMQSAFTQVIIEESGGDSSKVATSYATADRARREVGKKISDACKDIWLPPTLASLHWDSKLMNSLTDQNTSEERLTVAVGNIHDIKLLGVPSYKPGTDRKSGDIISELTVNLLQEWHCQNSIVNMVFDTTASNTGHISAACVKIQESLDRALLWSGCRHHVGEVILTQVFNDLQIEASRSPEVAIFSRFRKNFELLPHATDQPLRKLDPSSFSEAATTLVETWRDETLQCLQPQRNLKRDDYLEFVELCCLFLGNDHQTAKFKKPGALHKARWMSKLLYTIKICLLADQIEELPAGTITSGQQMHKVRAFVVFATLVYSSWWITSPSATDAPWHDLKLFHKLLIYEAVNPDISKSAVKALKRHLWYLTAEMVPLALFSDIVPGDQKRLLADRLLALKPDTIMLAPQKRFGYAYGKPAFPDITQATTLSSLVDTDSWFTLHLLQINPDFLAEEVNTWPDLPSYQESAANVEAVNVINDCAERGVKLSSDFINAAKSEQHYQNVLQVVEQDRKNMPNLRKRKSTSDN